LNQVAFTKQLFSTFIAFLHQLSHSFTTHV
jgi:hypothetical protein